MIRGTDYIVGEHKLAHLIMVECPWWLDGVVFEALKVGVGRGIENWFINRSATRLETATTHFVRVGFSHHITSAVWYAWVLRCRTSGEAGDGQIKGSPEKVYRTDFAGFAPDEGESLLTFIDPATLPPGFLIVDSGGFAYINPDMFPQAFAQDVNTTEAEIMAVVQTPTNQSILGEPSGPPAWKQLPTWYQVSESDHIIPPDAERQFAQRMNATTISINSSHASPVSHPNEVAQLILDAAKGSTS